MSLSHFDERAGIVACQTPWGRWWQTVGEVYIDIDVPEGTRAKDCKVVIKSKHIDCQHRDKILLKGELYKPVIVEDCTWTLEEKRRISILLTKTEKFSHENLWESLLTGEYAPDPLMREEIIKKLELEKFQIENPGFDFSSALMSRSS